MINNEKGSVSNGILLWMIGVPLPVILLFSLFKHC